jgi:hypothetical protein
MPVLDIESYKFTMTTNQLSFFIDKIHDLLSIDDEILIKVKNDNILLYSIVGEKMNVNAFKSFIFKTSDVFSFKTELSKEIRFIVTNGKKFESVLNQLSDYNQDINCEFFMNDDTYADNFKLRNSVLKLSVNGGDVRGMNTSIDIDKINSTLNKDNIDFEFKLDKSSYLKIKKIASIDNENDILTLSINDKSLTIGENNWDLKICDIEHDNLIINFPKKYFKSITYTEDTINVYVFDTFLLIDNSNTSLLIALELTV